MKKKMIVCASLLWSVYGSGVCAVTNQEFSDEQMNTEYARASSAVADQPEYAAIWQTQKDGAIWQARHGMSGVQYQKIAEQLKQEGFRVVHISAQGANKMVRFVAIWTESGDMDWQARHDLTAAQYQSIHQELTNDGYQLTSLNDYEVYGEPRYAAVWQKDVTRLATQTGQHVMVSEYQKAFNELIQKGYKLVQVSESGQYANDRCDAIWWAREQRHLIDFNSVFDYSSQLKPDYSVLKQVDNGIYLQ